VPSHLPFMLIFGGLWARAKIGVENMVTLRSAVLATAFAVAVAAFSLPPVAETRESDLAEACAHETWPAIPAWCLTGDVKPSVRAIPIVRPSTEMRARFALAFE